MLLEEEARSASMALTTSQKDDRVNELAVQLAQELEGGSDLTNSDAYEAMLVRLYEDSGGAAANLASHTQLVRMLFAGAARLQDASLMLLFKVATWDVAREKFAISLSLQEQVTYLQHARRDCKSPSLAAQARTGLVVCTLALVSHSEPLLFSNEELQAVVALVTRAIQAKADKVRQEMQHATRTVWTGMEREGERELIHHRLHVHEALTALLHAALAPANHGVLLAARPALEDVLELWQGFATAHLFPIAVRLQGEEVFCSSDVDLCVGLVFMLAGVDQSRAELEAVISPMALRGLKHLVKHSTSATSRRFGGKALYLLSTSSSSKGSALLNLTESMDSGKAFAGFPLRDINSPAIRWQGERQSQASDLTPQSDPREGVLVSHERGFEREEVLGFVKGVSTAVETMGGDLGIAGLAGLDDHSVEAGDLALLEKRLVEDIAQCGAISTECKRYSDAAERMLQLAHERHSSLRARAATLTRAVAKRIHLTNVAAVFDLWVSSLRKVRDDRGRMEGFFTRKADAYRSVDVYWGMWWQAVQVARAEARLEDEEAGRLAAEERWEATDASQRQLQQQLLELQQELQSMKEKEAVLLENTKSASGMSFCPWEMKVLVLQCRDCE